MTITKMFKHLEETVTLSTYCDKTNCHYTWKKNGEKLENEYARILHIPSIGEKDYAMYECVTTASNGSKDVSKFSLERPDFLQRSDSYESIEVELPPIFQKTSGDSSPSLKLPSHPSRIPPYEPNQNAHIDTRHIPYSSRHDLHPKKAFPEYLHSPQIQPYFPTPTPVRSAPFHGYYYPSPAVHNNEGPSNYPSFYTPYVHHPPSTLPKYLNPRQTGSYKAPQVQATHF